MMGVIFEPDTPETRKAMQNKARHELILRIHNDILVDLAICDIEGWDKTEYIHMLYDMLKHFEQSIRGVSNY